MKIYLVRVKYSTPKGVTVTREFICDGETYGEAEQKVAHNLEEVIWMPNYIATTVEIPTPYEIF